MKYVVFGDIHNSAKKLGKLPSDGEYKYLCTGGICESDPGSAMKAIDFLKEVEARVVCGTRDRPVFDDENFKKWILLEEKSKKYGWGKEDLFRRFYEGAKNLRENLGQDYIDYLRKLDDIITFTEYGTTIQMVHDTLPLKKHTEEQLRKKMKSIRVINEEVAKANFESRQYEGGILLVGHSHHPVIYQKTLDNVKEVELFDPDTIFYADFHNIIINPGSMDSNRFYADDHGLVEIVAKGSATYGILDVDGKKFEIIYI
jgi:predicted phosphodiesterase